MLNEIKSTRFLTITVLILLAAFSRLIPHPYNATAMGAMAIFGGATFRNKGMAFVVTFASLLLSDLVISGFYPGIWLTYVAFAIVVCLGFILKERMNVRNIILTSLVSSTVFFLVTNFAFFYPPTLYPRTWGGVLASYTAGLEFYRNELIASLFYCLILFGSLGFVQEKLLKKVNS